MANVVLVVDMLKGFMESGHNLYSGDDCRDIIPNVKMMLERELGAGSSIFFICDNHESDGLEFRMFPQHCVKGSEETDVIPELSKFVTEHNIVPKNRYSGFFNTNLERELRALNPEVVMCVECVPTSVSCTLPQTLATGIIP